MSFDQKKKALWNPRLGIRFSPRREPSLLYPQLDVARFLHAPDLESPGSHHESELITSQARLNGAGKAFGGLLAELQGPEMVGISPNHRPAARLEAAADESISVNEAEIEQDGVTEEEIAGPPWTPLHFNISSELFHAARASAAGSEGSFWSHTMYQSSNHHGWVQKVKVHYCTSRHSMENVCKKYFLGESVLGFDLEWLAFATRHAGPRENVSLIQVASPGHIGLFHVALFPEDGDFVAPTFRQLIEDPNVSKAGVNIRADFTRLNTNLGVNARGIFELSHLYKVVKFLPKKRKDLINKSLVALSVQVLDHLRLPLYKGQSVRSGNWMKRLDERQILYSAADAYAGIQLYHVLETKRKALSPCPPRPHHAELGLPIPLPEYPADEEASGSAPSKPKRSTPSKSATPKPKTPKPRKTTPPKPRGQISPDPGGISRDTRIAVAELQMEQYRSAKQAYVLATPSALRAYYMWYGNDDLKPADIAGLLRDPPLKTNTIVSYVLDAILAEKLPYSKPRLKNEIVSHLYGGGMLSSTKYKTLVQDCQSA